MIRKRDGGVEVALEKDWNITQKEKRELKYRRT